ncbi:MAG: 4Fe-4S binding protein [Actinobacteria bacterium]|nr:4Fe-4S binding protein [Actinomycetota bacterium]
MAIRHAGPKVTPDPAAQADQPSARRRGAIALIPDQCTSCMICVRECPVWCISLSAEKRHNPDAGPRGRSTLVLTDFSIDFGLCMDCGICIDSCPTDALEWVPRPLSGEPDQSGLKLDAQGLARLLPAGRLAEHPLL